MENLYFAYGSNMNFGQMEYRCPAAVPVGAVRLDGYRLAFRGAGLSAVATILPEIGSHVDGVLWRITTDCEKSLDRYEGYPNFYGKQAVCITDAAGNKHTIMAYVMNEPYCNRLGIPSRTYADGILEGAVQNGIDTKKIRSAMHDAAKECRYQKYEVCEVEQLSFARKPKQKNWYTR
ncbi:MAG: gamma-glutamylcyclotransferase family protein [Oscillospiraceae bacterium]